MTNKVRAYTKSDSSFPGYINVRQEGDSVIITVRADPTKVQAAYICGYAGQDTGKLGRCTPGDNCCNNYCNMAPEKGPMQDHPMPCEQVIEGKTAQLRLSAEEFAAFLAELTN